MKGKWNVWHNTLGTSDAYFLFKGMEPKWMMPQGIGRLIGRTVAKLMPKRYSEL